MALSALEDESREPRSGDLEKVLGRSAVHWAHLTKQIAATYAPCEASWSHGGAKWGWTLRLRHRKRTVMYMTPCHRHFLVGFVPGEKAVRAARAAPRAADATRPAGAVPGWRSGSAAR